jgi:hypothetical protein
LPPSRLCHQFTGFIDDVLEHPASKAETQGTAQAAADLSPA